MLRIRAGSVHPVTAPPITDGAVLVADDGRIAAVAAHAQVPDPAGARRVEFPGAVLVPGLVNAHTHLELTHLAGRNPEREFSRWIRTIRSLKDATTPEEFDHAAEQGVRDCWTAGVTCVADTGSTGAPLRALARLGARGIYYQEVFGPDPADRAASLAELQAALVRLAPVATSRARLGGGARGVPRRGGRGGEPRRAAGRPGPTRSRRHQPRAAGRLAACALHRERAAVSCRRRARAARSVAAGRASGRVARGDGSGARRGRLVRRGAARPGYRSGGTPLLPGSVPLATWRLGVWQLSRHPLRSSGRTGRADVEGVGGGAGRLPALQPRARARHRAARGGPRRPDPGRARNAPSGAE